MTSKALLFYLFVAAIISTSNYSKLNLVRADGMIVMVFAIHAMRRIPIAP